MRDHNHTRQDPQPRGQDRKTGDPAQTLTAIALDGRASGYLPPYRNWPATAPHRSLPARSARPFACPRSVRTRTHTLKETALHPQRRSSHQSFSRDRIADEVRPRRGALPRQRAPVLRRAPGSLSARQSSPRRSSTPSTYRAPGTHPGSVRRATRESSTPTGAPPSSAPNGCSPTSALPGASSSPHRKNSASTVVRIFSISSDSVIGCLRLRCCTRRSLPTTLVSLTSLDRVRLS
jgi:hypothetical protein